MNDKIKRLMFLQAQISEDSNELELQENLEVKVALREYADLLEAQERVGPVAVVDYYKNDPEVRGHFIRPLIDIDLIPVSTEFYTRPPTMPTGAAQAPDDMPLTMSQFASKQDYDKDQIINALSRAKAMLDEKAQEALRNLDYSAELYDEDAKLIEQAVEMLKGEK